MLNKLVMSNKSNMVALSYIMVCDFLIVLSVIMLVHLYLFAFYCVIKLTLFFVVVATFFDS